MTKFNTLVILAAGNGSRFGGYKQFTPFGKQQKTLMEYNIDHALDVGFNHIVFIVQAEQKAILEQQVITRLPTNIKIDIAIQSITDLPEQCVLPKNRTKPLGTAHALWCARRFIHNAFIVINADDYYAQQAFTLLNPSKLQQLRNKNHHAMVAYHLSKTLSAHGGVNRGLCQVTDKLKLKTIDEIENIVQGNVQSSNGQNKNIACDQLVKTITGRVAATQQPINLAESTLISMNFWGFMPTIINALEQALVNKFSDKTDDNIECYLPDVINHQLKAVLSEVEVLTSTDQWLGVTYASDKVHVDETLP